MPTLLIVEDQAELGRLLAAALEDAGYEVRVARRVDEALAALTAAAPGGILLDLLLPDGLGFAVAEAAGRLPTRPAVVGISGVFRQDPSVRDALSRGLLDAFFDKPFHLPEVLARLQALIPDATPAPAPAYDPDQVVRLEAVPVEGTPQDYVFDPPEAGLEAALRAQAEKAPEVEPPKASPGPSGSLAEHSVPRLLNAFHVSRETGELHLQRGKVRKVIYFHEGLPAFGASNLRRDRFDELLLRQGALDEAAIRAAAEEASERGERIDRVLLGRGLLSRARHRALVTRQVKGILFSLFPWREGTWRMTFQRQAEAEPVRLDIFPTDLVLEGVHTLTLPVLRDLLPGHLRLAPAPAPAYELYDLPLTGPQAQVVARLDGTRTVADLSAEGWLDRRDTWALLYALFCLQVVEDASLLLL